MSTLKVDRENQDLYLSSLASARCVDLMGSERAHKQVTITPLLSTKTTATYDNTNCYVLRIEKASPGSYRIPRYRVGD
jgi:hypothetical protein